MSFPDQDVLLPLQHEPLLKLSAVGSVGQLVGSDMFLQNQVQNIRTEVEPSHRVEAISDTVDGFPDSCP